MGILIYILCCYYLQKHSQNFLKISLVLPGPIFTHIYLHWVLMISYIPGVTTGSPNNDPPCSADTERLPTRNPRKDYLTETFILSPLLCLLCSQYSIPDDILVFANEQVSVCVTKARKSSYADSKAHPHGGPWGDQLKSIPRVSAWHQAVLVGFTDRNMVGNGPPVYLNWSFLFVFH